MDAELERTLIIASALLIAAITVAMLDELKKPQSANTLPTPSTIAAPQAECAK